MPISSRLVLLPALLALAALAAGCRHGPAACAKPGVYAEAQSVPPLQIPQGLDALDTRGALRIPELNEEPGPLPPGARCLDDPPRFSPNAQLEPPPRRERERRRGRGQEATTPAPIAPAGTPPAPAPAPPAPAPAR